MDERKTKITFWTLCERAFFERMYEDCEDEDYHLIKQSREKISQRYAELKSQNFPFSQAAQIASMEWLSSL